MTETVAPVANPAPRPRSRKPATVSASALALHLDCSRTYIGRLEAEGVIQRQGDGFPLDQSRVAYLRYLRRERRQSLQSAAASEFAAAKAELIRVRVETDGDAPYCQSALEWDPLSASKRDPFDRRVLLVALVASELVGVAETARARVVLSSSRLLKRQLSLPVSTMSQ
jgi:hypothetical protein